MTELEKIREEQVRMRVERLKLQLQNEAEQIAVGHGREEPAEMDIIEALVSRIVKLEMDHAQFKRDLSTPSFLRMR